MELRVSLAPDGGLRLHLPTGRKLDVGLGPSAVQFIYRILLDHDEGKRDQRGYIGEYPTQHVIEIWKKQEAELKVERAKEDFAAKGINLDALDFQL